MFLWSILTGSHNHWCLIGWRIRNRKKPWDRSRGDLRLRNRKMYGISTWNRSEKTRLLEERDRDGQGGRRGRLRDRSNKISNPIIFEIFIHLDDEKMYKISYLFIECKDSWNNCYPSDCKFSSRYCQKTCGLCGKLTMFLNQKCFPNFCVIPIIFWFTYCHLIETD